MPESNGWSGYWLAQIVEVRGDGVLDVVFCGNSGQAHVLTLTELGCEVICDSPPPEVPDHRFTQTCSVGDATRDGVDDIVVVHWDATQVFSHDGQSFYRVWFDGPNEIVPSLGSSFVGDADNTCSGAIDGESCTTCPEDCGCCGDGTCGKPENASNSPVDCS